MLFRSKALEKIFYKKIYVYGRLRRSPQTADTFMEYASIDTDIPYAEYPPTFEDLEARVDAAFRSLTEIADGVEVTDADILQAQNIFQGTIKATDTTLSSPGTVVHIKAILSAYDQAIVQSAVQIRNYVTNKLIEDSANPDPDRKSTRLNSSHMSESRMPSSA